MIERSMESMIGTLEGLLAHWAAQLAKLLFSPGSPYSIAAIACVVAIAGFATLHGRRAKRSVPMRALARALFPARLYRSRSGRLDILFTLFNIFLAATLFGWAILSHAAVAGAVREGLAASFGPAGDPKLSVPLAMSLMTLAFYLVYEFTYWLYHYLSHRIPLLWHFHAVHHAAESLSPLTNFRVHPVDSIIFYNMIALFTGVAVGTAQYLIGQTVGQLSVYQTNVIMLAAAVLLTHLQHTHLWISFPGAWGRILLSPAHHQIHHSADPVHFNRNFGHSLAIWDRLFGTLHVPARKREKLSFGVAALDYDPHSIKGGLLHPLLRAWSGILADVGRLTEQTYAPGPAISRPEGERLWQESLDLEASSTR